MILDLKVVWKEDGYGLKHTDGAKLLSSQAPKSGKWYL